MAINLENKIKYSKYQVAIFNHLKTQLQNIENNVKPQSLLVNAYAGSGKTSTLVACANIIPKNINVLFLCFNKDIQMELQNRLTHHKASTLNSFGYSTWINYYKGYNKGIFPQLDENKTFKLSKKEYEFRAMPYYATIRQLISLCKNHGIVTDDVTDAVGIDLKVFDKNCFYEFLKEYSIFIPVENRDTIFEMTKRLLTLSLKQEDIIDFDDQKYLPVVKRVRNNPILCEKYDIIFIDELQDVNKVDMQLVFNALKENGMVIGTGDRNQAIYKFRGSDSSSMDKFVELFGAVELPLSICYRCDLNIIKHAQELVPQIEPKININNGLVETLKEYDSSIFKPGDMVLCRNNYPLINLAYKLITVGVPVYVKGRDIGSGIKTLINNSLKLYFDKKKSFSEEDLIKYDCQTLLKAVDIFQEKEIERLLKNDIDMKSTIENLIDRCKVLRIIVSHNIHSSIKSVIDDINVLFSDKLNSDSSQIQLSTVHKAKGLENDRVFILDKELFHYYKNISNEDQEKNLDYVARTRAKNELYYIKTENYKEM